MRLRLHRHRGPVASSRMVATYAHPDDAPGDRPVRYETVCLCRCKRKRCGALFVRTLEGAWSLEDLRKADRG